MDVVFDCYDKFYFIKGNECECCGVFLVLEIKIIGFNILVLK